MKTRWYDKIAADMMEIYFMHEIVKIRISEWKDMMAADMIKNVFHARDCKNRNN